MTSSEKLSSLGPFKPTVILHGGAGAPSRANLPPELWARYQASLETYLTATRKLLDSGASALNAACHAVALFEDDVLFNCGRGSVFTERGTIEMEASVMVCSVNPDGPPEGGIKRAAAVSMIRNTRHPILLAKEVLVSADDDGGLGGTSTMHCHLSGRDIEVWGWAEKALEKKEDMWFWTQKRWEEHRRGLSRDDSYSFADLIASVDALSTQLQQDHGIPDGVKEIPTQGTVGAVCLDSWGNLAVATSTGGLTNKKSGRIGDTPTIGAGFWAEAWETTEKSEGSTAQHGRAAPHSKIVLTTKMPIVNALLTQTSSILGSCLNPIEEEEQWQQRQTAVRPSAYSVTSATPYQPPSLLKAPNSLSHRPIRYRRHALAMSGTGNGDSFLRTDACRTAASICRLDHSSPTLSDALSSVTGPNGLLQRSAGDRWLKTGEGQGGIIGIEVLDESGAGEEARDYDGTNMYSKKKRGQAVFDFNCEGLFRAYYEVDEKTGSEKPKVMVFKGEY